MRSSLISALILYSTFCDAQSKMLVYCVSGQGSTPEIFKEINVDTSRFVLRYIDLKTPSLEDDMTSYAKKHIQLIDTNQRYCLIGVSLGGMVITEMMDVISPAKAIIISSAKCRKELPFTYRIQKFIPLNEMLPKSFIKLGAFIAQPIVEPDRKLFKSTFIRMLRSKSPEFYKRSIRLITTWNRSQYSNAIVHIHGDNDHTLPINNLQPTITISGGSHMMLLTKHKEVELVINAELMKVY